MQIFKKVVGYGTMAFVVLILLCSSSAKAQVLPVYHPSDVIRISVTFDGPDAGKITSVNMYLVIPTVSQNQPGFQTDFRSGVFNQTGPSAFEISYKIPENQASGEYRLAEILAIINQSAPIRLAYESPADFPAKTFKIENPKTIVKPTIKDVKVL